MPKTAKNLSIPLSRLPSVDQIETELSRRRCQASFREFAKQAWHVIEPSTALKWNWAMDAICDHLQAVHEGHIKRLLMNVPPGTSKSTLTGVLYPAWVWTRDPSKRFLGTAHKAELAHRDNLKCRRIIQSEWYQKRWKVELTGDANRTTKFENKATGFRESMAFTGMTGSRGDCVILDDPISAGNSNSEAELYKAEIEFTETLPTRVNNDESAIIVVMQRLNERDTSGLILSRDLGYEHLMLPMRFEPERKCHTSIGFEDPREYDGELLFPERFPETQVASLEKTMGSFGAAGQLQQRPIPRGGGLFQRSWFNPIKEVPVGTKFFRGWDLAASTNATSAYTAGVKLGLTPEGRIVVAHAIRDRMSAGKVIATIRATAMADTDKTKVSIPQDPGQAGKAQKEGFAQQLREFNVHFSPESGDKVTRAEPFAAQAEAGLVDIVIGEWTDAYLDEISTFPNGSYLDQVDATSRAYHALLRDTAKPKASIGFGPRLIS